MKWYKDSDSIFKYNHHQGLSTMYWNVIVRVENNNYIAIAFFTILQNHSGVRGGGWGVGLAPDSAWAADIKIVSSCLLGGGGWMAGLTHKEWLGNTMILAAWYAGAHDKQPSRWWLIMYNVIRIKQRTWYFLSTTVVASYYCRAWW